ncbi:MAG: DUF5658 family protein [Planctomycetota bacterium]|nr:DUF5658 family protein [Planctomycetota bacterium]
MSTQPPQKPWIVQRWLDELLVRPFPHLSLTTAFIILNGIDVVITYTGMASGHLTEVNPIASYFIDHWGLTGMLWFKFGIVAFVMVLVKIIARKHRHLSRGVLIVGNLIVGAVVVYGLNLSMKPVGSPEML